MFTRTQINQPTKAARPLRPIWFGVAVLAVLALVGCEKSESDAPEFDGLSKSIAISESQVSLHWAAAQDDRSHVDEIAYAVWVAQDGEVLDVDAPAQFITGEGANSYALMGLEPDTVYQVLVRAEDRGGNRSENEEIFTISTPRQGEGMFSPEQLISLDREVSNIVVGTLNSGGMRALGTLANRRIDWWEFDDQRQLVPSTLSRIETQEDLVEAHLVRIRDRNVDDIFVLTVRELIQMHNNGEGEFSTFSDAFFPEIPQRNTINFVHMDDDAHLDLVYANPLGRIVFFGGHSNGEFSAEGFYDTGSFPQSMHVRDLDGENGPDFILLTQLGIAVLLAEEDDFSFGPIGWIGLPMESVPEFDRLLIADDDGDGDRDIFVYIRDETEHLTRLFRYDNGGNGEFDSPDEVDFASAAFGHRPETADINRDGFDDVFFPQGESNNLVVYLGGNTPWSEVAYAIGGDDAPDWAWIGLLDSDDQDDVVLLSSQSQSMSVLLTDHQ